MEDLKEISARFFKEAFANRDLSVLDEVVAEDFIDHQTPPPGMKVTPGRKGIKQVLEVYLDAFDPLTAEPVEVYQDGNTIISHVLFTGTHTGEFAGIPATGKTASVEGIQITRYENGMAAEHWGLFDAVSLLTQIGAIPPMD